MSPPPPATTICVNGRFLTQAASGVQRFALELLLALDRHLGDTEAAGARRVELLVPDGVAALPPLRRVQVRHVPGRGSHLWDQLLRRHCPADAVMLNLANGGCVLRRRSLSVLHDAGVYLTPGNFTWRYALWHRLLGRLLALQATIATVSASARHDLCQVLGLAPADVPVIGNASDHLAAVEPDAGIVGRLQLEPGRYFVMIGSTAPNKNMQRAVDAFAQLGAPGERLVIVGGFNASVFGRGAPGRQPGVLLPGRLADAEIAGLLHQARALVFPSLYEGFGIPPLEAMACGCPVLASDIPVVREVCGAAALRFDPLDPAAMAAAMRRAIDDAETMAALRRQGFEQVRRYTWRHSALHLLRALDAMVATDAAAPLAQPKVLR